MGIFNWILPFGQVFIYVYYIIGFEDIMALVTVVMGLVSFDVSSLASGTGSNPITGLTTAFEALGKKLSWGIPGGIFISVCLNTSVSWWVMIYHTGSDAALTRIRDDPNNTQMDMYWQTVMGFFYSWWIIGWAMPLLMAMEWILGAAGDETKYTIYHYILILGTAGFWLMTAIVNTWAWSTMQWGWAELMILRSYMNVAIENGEIDSSCYYADEGCVPGAPASAFLEENEDNDEFDVPEDDSWNVMSAVTENGISFH